MFVLWREPGAPAPGFFHHPTNKGNWTGLDVDVCRGG